MSRLPGALAAALFLVAFSAGAQAHRAPRPSFARAPIGPPQRMSQPQPYAHSALPQQAFEQHNVQPTTIAAQTEQRPPQPRTAPSPAMPLVNPAHPNQSQQHLAGWMQAHRNMPLPEQQRALDNEPGFRSLPPQEQQRLHDRLTQLNNMPPQQREKVLERNEAMERLAPPQRQQVRNAMAQLGSLPEDRRHAVSRTFYQLRDIPPAQRQAYMNSPQFRNQFSDQERGALNGLFQITPIWPPLQAQSGQPGPPR
jgi:hypothetical protein